MAFNSYMHERNIYRNQPDFTQIALDIPAFRKYAVPDATGKKVHVDFSNPDALRMVTEILLKKDFNLDVEIPQGFLIPTVPQRLNYILWLEDLLHNVPQRKNFVSGIDIGTGPCAIFSILGARKNNWNFIATETSDDAIHWAKKNIEKNNLKDNIRIVKVSPGITLSEVLSSNEENYDFCLCNPPFFENIGEIRKKHHHSYETIADVAQKEEIFFKGGELNFVKNILSDSIIYKDRISLFTSMFGKKKSFLQILKEIKELKDVKVTTTEFCQGNTIRWGIAWTFNETVEFEKADRKIKPKKAKPPLEYQIPLKNSTDFNIHILMGQMKNFLQSLLIPVTVTRYSQYFAELLLKSDKNTWTHQRRKRREMERQKRETSGLENEPSVASVSEVSQVEVSVTDSGAIPEQNISMSVDVNESNLSKDNAVTSVDVYVDTDIGGQSEHREVNTEIIPPENITSSDCKNETSGKKVEAHCPPFAHDKMHKIDSKPISDTVDSASSQNTSPNNKRNDFCHDDSLINKKLKLDLGEKNGKNLCSEESTNLSLESSVSGLKESCILETASDSKIPQNEQEDIGVENSSVHLKKDLDSSQKADGISTQQDSVLHCNLQLIKGKNKIYVKMNCPPSADRNSMYQVFQLIKNKIK